MSGYRAVVNDPAALWFLFAHQAKGAIRYQESAVEIDVDYGFPVFKTDVAERRRLDIVSGIVKYNVQSAEFIFYLSIEIVDLLGISHIGCTGKCIVGVAVCDNFVE